jgi:hypothetical protein
MGIYVHMDNDMDTDMMMNMYTNKDTHMDTDMDIGTGLGHVPKEVLWRSQTVFYLVSVA